MRGIDRTLVNPPVSSREAFAALDAKKAAEAEEAKRPRVEGEDIERAERASGSTPC